MKYQFSEKFKNIPILPPSDPNQGNFPDVLKAGSLHNFLIQQHQNLGEIFQFYWQKQLVVSLGHQRLFKDILYLSGRPPQIYQFLEPLIPKKSAYFTNTVEANQRKCKYFDPGIAQKQLENTYNSILTFTAEKFINELKEISNKKKEVNLQRLCLDIAANVILKGIFSEAISDEDIQKIIRPFDICWKEINNGLFMEKPIQNQELFYNNLQELNKQLIIQLNTLKENKQIQHQNFKKFLLDEPDQDLAISEILTQIVQGYQTTGNLLFFSIYYLATNPQKLNILQNELDTILGQKKIITKELLAKLKYLKGSLHESLRLSKIVTWGFRQNLQEDTILCSEYSIPKGMEIIIPFGKMLEEPNLWQNTDQFLPERLKDGQQLPIYYNPFGRLCPGKNLSYMLNSILLGAVFKHFNVTLSSKNMEYSHQLITSPKTQITASFQTRG